MSSAPPEAAPGATPPGTTLRRLRGGWERVPLSIRLTLGYAVLFAASALVLFGLTYGLLITYLRDQDVAFVEHSVRLYSAAYAEGGVEAVARAAERVRSDDLGEETLVRVADAANRTLLLLPPEDWIDADLDVLGEGVASEPPAELHNEREGQSLVVTASPLDDGRTLQVGISSDERDDVMETFPDVFLALSLPLLLLAFVGGAFMAHRALRPIRHLVRTFKTITETGDVRQRAPVPGAPGEMSELFVLFNRMLARIEALVSGMRHTLDTVAHDLRTPLTRLRGTAEVALGEPRDAHTYREALGDVLEAAEGLTTTLDTLMDVAEAEAGAMPLDRGPVRLADLACDVASLYELVAEAQEIAFHLDVSPDATASADRNHLRRVLANLVDNALKYTPPGGTVRVIGRTHAQGVMLAVEDTGPGIAPEDAPRIWDRLYRGDASRTTKGLGLGLSLVRAIVEAHGGYVTAENVPEGGARVAVVLPAPS